MRDLHRRNCESLADAGLETRKWRNWGLATSAAGDTYFVGDGRILAFAVDPSARLYPTAPYVSVVGLEPTAARAGNCMMGLGRGRDAVPAYLI